MKIKMMSFALAGAFAMNVGAALAEDVQFDGSWYLMPGVGVMHTDSSLDADSNNASYSLRLGKQLAEHWDIQVGGSYAKADEDGNNLTGGDYKQTLFGVDVLYMLSRSNFRPFLLAGVGGARNDIDYRSSNGSVGDKRNSWMGEAGVGFQYLFNKNVGMQADLRQVWSKTDGDGVGNNGKNVDYNDTVGNTYLNLGVFFNFGGKVAAPVAVAAAEPVSSLPEVAPVDDGTYEFIVEETVVEEGPAAPAVKVTLAAEVLFDFDKAVLKDEGKNLLNTEVVEKMKAHPEAELVMVTGYTDRIGSDKYNQSLSERRANAVKDYIVSQGVEESRLKAAGKGEQNPVVDCKGVRGKKLIECLQPNRRVVVETEVQRTVEPAAAE
jgi:OmpA-OmpF porin, OOP family